MDRPFGAALLSLIICGVMCLGGVALFALGLKGPERTGRSISRPFQSPMTDLRFPGVSSGEVEEL